MKDHPWLQDWKLPFEDHGGNLHPIGENVGGICIHAAQ